MARKVNKISKVLSATALAGCALGATQAQAADTLATPTLGNESFYTLTEVGRGDNFDTTTLEGNYITKYEYDSETGAITPVYYESGINPELILDEIREGQTTHEVYTSADLIEKSYFDNTSTENGGALSIDGDVGKINGHFLGNSSSARYANGGALYSSWDSTIDEIKGDFLENEAIYGGAVYNNAEVGSIKGDYIGNYAEQSGGAILNSGVVDSLEGDFIQNYSHSGGAIYNNGYLKVENSTFTQNGADYDGGAIVDIDGGILEVKDSMFTENIVDTWNGDALGGAIYVDGPQPKMLSDEVEPYQGYVQERFSSIENSTFIRNKVTNKSSMQTESLALTDGGATTYMLTPTLGGGAIGNVYVMDKIDGDFIENKVEGIEAVGYGGAIANAGQINETITGTFKGNTVESTYDAVGGAIANLNGMIGSINSYDDETQVINIDVYKLTAINAETGEEKTYYMVAPQGGNPEDTPFTMLQEALDEGYKIGTVGATQSYQQYMANDEFTELVANYDAAVANNQILTEHPTSLFTQDNYYEIADFNTAIDAEFINNAAISYDSIAKGGAIANMDGFISGIKGKFENNVAFSEYSSAAGGAISNEYGDNAIIGEIGGEAEEGQFAVEFKDNKAISYSNYNAGGAIANAGTIGNINNALFEGNKAGFENPYVNAAGGAICNDRGVIGGKQKYQEDNSISTYDDAGPDPSYYTMLYNKGIMNSTFKNNEATAYNRIAVGGAIANDRAIISTIGNSVFEGNIAQSLRYEAPTALYQAYEPNNAYGGALYNVESSINEIKNTVFKDNLALSLSEYAAGGAIYNGYYSEIGAIENSIFEGNKAEGAYHTLGGAIYNEESIGDISGEFKNNAAIDYDSWAEGGAIYNDNSATIGNINANFSGNYALSDSEYGNAMGGAIAIEGSKYKNINGNFVGNYVQGARAYGGALFLTDGATGGSNPTISGTFDGNYAHAKSSATDAWTTAQGGAIYNGRSQMAGSLLNDTPSTYTSMVDPIIYNASFTNNYAKAEGEDSLAEGGAIYSNRSLILGAADGYKSIISGNYVEDSAGKRAEAIYADYTDLTFYTARNGEFVIDDIISGTDPKITFAGDGTGKITLNNDIKTRAGEYSLRNSSDGEMSELDRIYGGRTEVNLYNTTLHLGLRDNVLDDHYLTLDSGTLSMINNQVGVSNPYSLTVGADTKFFGDVDLENEVMDRFEVQEGYGEYNWDESGNVIDGPHGGNLIVSGFNMISDMKEGQDTAAIYFAEKGLMNNVVSEFGELPHPEQTTFYTPIYKYNAVYDNTNDYGQGEGGYYVFTRGDKIPVITPGGGSIPTGNPSDAYNPAVLGSSVAAAAGAMSTVGQTFNYAFQHSDNFMHIPYLERIAKRNANKYALSPTGDATDVGTFSPLFTKNDNGSVWVKPYASFENIDLDNGPKVSNISYGTLIGFDSEMKYIGKGWDAVFTGYIGYNGASQRYSGVDSYQNGGLIGGTMTLYKGNFFNATTLSTGASVASNTNMYGHENFAMLMAGVGNKAGYNFEFKEGKFIIQPSMLLSYTFVNTFDYTNAAGARIESDPLHAIQLAPGVKFIANTKNGWQPYVGVSMVWNILDDSRVTANSVKLPSMSMKPYVQYGVGVQKRIKDHFMAYGQAMIQNGGRNGIALSGGFRWSLGRDAQDAKNDQKVFKPFLKNKFQKAKKQNELKQVSMITPNEKKVLKQLSIEQKIAMGANISSITKNSGILKQV